MRQELYATLRERIVKIVPEITELKFGCRTNHGYISGEFESLGSRKYATSFCAQFDSNTINGHLFTKSQLKILGRDIQLADVLRAMQEVDLPDDEFLAAYPYRDTKQKDFWLCHKKERDFDMNREEYVISSMRWNLDLPLHEQSDELGEWLLTVIK